MSTTKTILNQLKTTLSADPTLSAAGYIQKVELGLRAMIPEQDFPLIMIEPDAINENAQAFPQIDGHFIVLIAAYTRVFDVETQMVGDANYKGVLDLEKDIKLALGLQYPTLNGTVLEFTFPKTEFVVRQDMAKFPVRGVLIQVDLHYRTRLDTRT